MLWSLVKIILFVCLVAAAAFGAVALLEADGGLQIQFGGTEYLLGPLETVIALIVLVLIVWFF